MFIFLILGILLGALAVIFALQNISVITVTFLVWQLHGSLALILLLAVITGVIINLLLSLPSSIRTSIKISSLKKQNTKLKEDAESYKAAAEHAQRTAAAAINSANAAAISNEVTHG